MSSRWSRATAGVLVRTGHTEAAVDVARLAGLNPSGVICEIMKDDGSMARLDDLIPFAQKHRLKIGTIRDLIAYRRRNDHLIERRTEASFTSHWGGEWRAISFYNRATGTEQIALQKGHVTPDQPTMVRMHQISFFTDIFARKARARACSSARWRRSRMKAPALSCSSTAPEPDRYSRMLRARSEGAKGGARELDELRDYGGGARSSPSWACTT